MIYQNKYNNFICSIEDLKDIVEVYNAIPNHLEGSTKPSGVNVEFIFKQAMQEKKFTVLGSKKGNKLIGYMFIKIMDITEFMFIHHSEAIEQECLFELEILASMIAEDCGKLSYFYKTDKSLFFKEKGYALLNLDYNRYEKRIHNIVYTHDSNLRLRIVEKELIKPFIKRTTDILIVHALLKRTYVIDHFANNFNLSIEKIKKMTL